MMDDITIFGESSKEHDKRVRTIFQTLEDSGVTPNSEFTKSPRSRCVRGRVRGISWQGVSRQGDSTTKIRG